MQIFIIQPPMVQLNTPYPSGAYLSSFFKSQKPEANVKWFDFSNELFLRIFCKPGLEYIFEKSEKNALKLASRFESQGDENSAFQLRRFVCQSRNWINWIDKIVSMTGVGLQNSENSTISGREFVHEFVRSAHAPRGMRIENYLANLGRDVNVDDSKIIASLALADLTDYISMAYDRNFSLIRYAEGMAVSTSTFEDVEKSLNSPVLKDFYDKILVDRIQNSSSLDKSDSKLFLISVPFAGCFEAAVYTGKILKSAFGDDCAVCMGGGYVNTELREIQTSALFKYVDFLSYDKGYGSYKFILDNLKDERLSRKVLKEIFGGNEIYKIRYFDEKSGKISVQKESDVQLEKFEMQVVRSLIPDFSDIDFSNYPRLADDINPMHRIWNDGAWLKAYMAYGCYWHRCAFCDTSLDYVKDYCRTDYKNFYKGIYDQAEKAGVYGIHFVDEACPPAGLERFALENCRTALEGKPSLTYWGNIRFEKTFTRDLADLLSFGGFTAASAGLEIATGEGLETVNKGTDMENVVAACCAFKEAGILVHSYMIYGYWSQTEQDLINSMETLRQMFASGLLDSAFFHKFSLTKYSTVYRDWKLGKIKALKPIENGPEILAQNEIGFEGEEKSEKYSNALNCAVESWMHGEKLNKNVQSWFDFKMPFPSIPKDFVESLIARYEQKRDKAYSECDEKSLGGKKVVWIGSKPVCVKTGSREELCWSFMGELNYASTGANVQPVIEFLNSITAGKKEIDAVEALKILGKKLFLELRGKGLCRL